MENLENLEASEETKNLIKAMQKAFPREDGGYTCAVFFHHDKDGKLKTMSPLVGDPEKNMVRNFTLKHFVAALLEYSYAVKTMADTIVKDTLPNQ